MGLVVKTKTWADNDNVTYTDINSNFDTLYNVVNGNFENANIKSGAGIDPAKISGTAATLTATQTLTNKTITSPSITSPTVTSMVVDKLTSTSASPQFYGVKDLGTVGATETVNWNNGDRQKMTMDENLTITFSNATEGQTLTLYMLQDGSGTNTITFSNTIVWSDNSTPSWTTTASKMNIAVITYIGSTYYGVGNKFA